MKFFGRSVKNCTPDWPGVCLSALLVCDLIAGLVFRHMKALELSHGVVCKNKHAHLYMCNGEVFLMGMVN